MQRLRAYLFLLLSGLVTAAGAQPSAEPAPEPGAPVEARPADQAPESKPLDPDAMIVKSNVAGIELADLSVAKARQKLDEELIGKLDDPVALTDGVVTRNQTRRQLGASLATDAMLRKALDKAEWVPLELTVDTKQLLQTLRTLATDFAFAGRNAAVVDNAGKVRVDPGEMVRTLDIAATAERVRTAIHQDASTRSVSVALTKSPQAVRAELFAGIDSRLGRMTTSFNPAIKGRTHNMRLAATTIDGVLVPAGATFSMNEAVGERTAERGFQEAIIFVNGKEEKGLGGGVSQVTGTLFNAALLGGLKIVTYRTHSRPVAYLPIGRDATVAWGQFDMKFNNDTGAPVYIRYHVGDSLLTCTLYGSSKADRNVEISVTRKTIGPRRIDAVLYRTLSRDGKRVRERVGSSRYDWQADDGD